MEADGGSGGELTTALYPPDTHAEPIDGHKGRSGRRYGFACSNCRRRKARCDGALPTCQKCVSLAEPCVYDKSVETNPPSISAYFPVSFLLLTLPMTTRYVFPDDRRLPLLSASSVS